MPFLDIFSFKKEKKDCFNKIIIDYREKNSLVPSLLLSYKIPIEFAQLAVADYLIDKVAIERKTISDLKSSIINKRIFSQLNDLKQHSSFLLLIEGLQTQDIYSGSMHENAFRGFLLRVALEYKVPIIFTQDEKDTAKYLSVLARKNKPSSISLRPSKITFSKAEQLHYILEGFPHIGPATAKKLLAHFKTIKNIINAKEEELQPILKSNTQDFYSLINKID